jgi:rhodanese-related sulfurtransferase
MNASGQKLEIDVDPEEVAAWLASDRDVVLIDVREPYERDAGRIEPSRHIELVQLSAQADSIERGRPVVFYCRVGSRSTMAAQAFRGSGFEAYSMRGGIERWVQEGRELTPADGYVANH